MWFPVKRDSISLNLSVEVSKCVRHNLAKFISLTILPCSHSPSSNLQDCQEYKRHSLYSSLANGSLLVCGNDRRICHKIHNFHRSDTKYNFALELNNLRHQLQQRKSRASTKLQFLQLYTSCLKSHLKALRLNLYGKFLLNFSYKQVKAKNRNSKFW